MRKIKPEKTVTAKPVIPEVTPVAVSPESEQNRRVLENAIDTVCRYTDLVFGDTINDEDKNGYMYICLTWPICDRFRFYGQQEVVVWLKKCFEPLNRYDERTLRAKLRATDGVSYMLHNNKNLKEYLERNDKKR